MFQTVMVQIRSFISVAIDNLLKILALAGMVLVIMASSAASEELRYAPAPIDNPLKGFLTTHEHGHDSFPQTMRFRFFNLFSLVKGPGEYNWAPLETWLENIAAGGHQAVLRVYVDWPGGRRMLLPDFLIAQGINYHTVTERIHMRQIGDMLPDYNDTILLGLLTDFIAEFGRRHDGDPRIGFIQAGLIGSWGEWRCWHYPPLIQNHFIPGEHVHNEIVDAYTAAFPTTKVQMRFPDPFNVSAPVGYHDDWFGREGLDEYFKQTGPMAREKWRGEPMGGRFHPDLTKCLGENLCGFRPEEILSGIETNHLTYLVWPARFRDLFPAANDFALEWSRRTGYELHVTEVNLPGGRAGEPLLASVAITNTGVAPFYYSWPVELAASADGEIKARWTTVWDIRDIIPGEPATVFNQRIEEPGLNAGRYELLMAIPNPLLAGRPIRFANETQDQTLPGWLTLGSFEIPE